MESVEKKWVNWSFKQSIYYDKGLNIHFTRYSFWKYEGGVSKNIIIKQTSEKINIGKCDVMCKANTQTYEPADNTALCSVIQCTACTL